MHDHKIKGKASISHQVSGYSEKTTNHLLNFIICLQIKQVKQKQIVWISVLSPSSITTT